MTNKTLKKIMIGLTALFIFMLSVYKSNSNKMLTIKQEDKLQVGIPHYVDFEDVKTNEFMKKNNSSLYSQIKIKNTSNQELDYVTINLKIQKDKSNEEILPFYTLNNLKPNETAILTYEHENLEKSEKLKVESLEFDYKSGRIAIINKDSKFKYPKRDSSEKISIHSNEYFKSLDITKDVDKLDIKNIKTIKKDNKNYLEIDIKNTSNIEIKNFRLNFKESYKNNVIGDFYVEMGKLKPQESKTLKVDYKEDTKLELIGYRYEVYDSENKISHGYFLDLYKNTYHTYEEEDKSNIPKRIFTTICISLIMGLCFFILDKKASNLKKLAISQVNKDYKNKAKKLNIIKYILLFVFLIQIIAFS